MHILQVNTMSTKKSSFPLFSLITIIHLLSLLTSATNPSHILYEIDPNIRVYDDGKVERLSGTEIVHPSYDPKTRVLSKDIYIGSNLTSISARLFLPNQNDAVPSCKLPLLVYFQGGGFFTYSPFSPTYHNYLNSLAAEANAIAVSVNYRLSPEHPLPIGYQDSWLALKWVFSHSKSSGSEAWLNDFVDFGQVYLGGDSVGANIAHNLAIRVGLEETGLEGIEVHGLFLNCPYFWGTKRIGNEAGQPERVALVESIWIHAYPDSTGFDDPALNPGMEMNLGKLGCKNVLVYAAEYDILRDRGFYYEEALKRSNWEGKIKVVEVKGEDHVFNLISPNTTKAIKMLTQLGMFLNNL